ncbi:MAG: Xaa-Pro dipeptidase [Gammaproteobacteria bacterium]
MTHSASAGPEHVFAHYPDHLETLAARYGAALEGLPFDGVAVYSGNPVMVFRDDRAHPFESAPFYRQWIPVSDHAGSFVLVRPGEKPFLLLQLPDDYWHSVPEAPVGEWTRHFEIRIAGSAEEIRALMPRKLERWALLGPPDGEVAGWTFGEVNPGALVTSLEFDRRRKTAYEAACIARANRVAARGHLAARRAFLDGASEFQIHLAYLDATSHGEGQLPYENIIALNEHGATLHYGRLDRESPEDSRSFLIDAGATFNGYAADITRTWPASGETAFGELVAAMDQAQQSLAAAVRAGVSYVGLHEEAQLAVARLLKDFGLVDMAPEDMVQRRVSRTFLPHGLGHHLGLQVHDTGGKMAGPGGAAIPQPEAWPYLRNLRDVEEGNVLTVEPGLYFIDSLLEELRASPEGRHVHWDAVERFRPYGGVRIEDDVWVSPDGARNLSREAFAEIGGP